MKSNGERGLEAVKRTSVVLLNPDREAEEKLKALCSIASKLWNEVNYVRRRQFFEAKRVDLKGTYKRFYNKYKVLIGSATAQQVINKNNEAWRSFFGLLRAKREQRLPPFIKKMNPPGYRKRGKSRALWVALRNDQYRIEGDTIIIKGLGAVGRIKVNYKGLMHLKGRQGRMEIRYDSDRRRWYAHITFEVEEKAVRGEWSRVPRRPKGGLRAGIDIGIYNLFAVYIEDGKAKLVNGRPLKAISHYWAKEIASYQSTLNKYGLRTSRRLRLMYDKWGRQAREFIKSSVRQVVEWLYDNNVSTIYVGYPKMIAQSKGNFNTVQVWSYGYLLRRLAEVAEEYGISVVFIEETNTSQTCPIHGKGCGRRIKRGLFKCTKLNKVLNADLVASYNILMRGTNSPPITPSPPKPGIGVTGRRPGPGLNEKDVAPNLPAPGRNPRPLGRGGGQITVGSLNCIMTVAQLIRETRGH